MQNDSEKKHFYGPVTSKRYGSSLGIDPIFKNSVCSFDCLYCQLGIIHQKQLKRELFVSKEELKSDLEEFLRQKGEKKDFDVICFSGSGEPTLALNLKELADLTKSLIPDKELLILTNASLLSLPEVCSDLESFDRIIIKLDTESSEGLLKINRPCKDLSFDALLEGIRNFVQKSKAKLELQSMFLPHVQYDIKKYLNILDYINIKTVQINTPTRLRPLEWKRGQRGNHKASSQKMALSKENLQTLINTLRNNSPHIDFLTGLKN